MVTEKCRSLVRFCHLFFGPDFLDQSPPVVVDLPARNPQRLGSDPVGNVAAVDQNRDLGYVTARLQYPTIHAESVVIVQGRGI